MSEALPQAEPAKAETPVFEFSYWPLLTDYLLRWVVFEVWRLDLIPGWLFWVCQTVAIPLPILIISSRKEDRLKLKYGVTGQTVVEGSMWATLLCWFVLLSGCFTTFYLYKGVWPLWGRWVLAILAFIVYGWYVVVLYLTPTHPVSKADRRKELENLEAALSDDEAEIVDANDVRIVRMETEVSSISQRVESYTLESALFGALAFSGFLTLISSDKPILNNLQELLESLSGLTGRLLQTGLGGIDLPLESYATRDNLFAAVAVETLVSSLFFVSVIVSRLRFYGYLRRFDYAVRIARMYNDKEEEIFHLKLQFKDDHTRFDERLTSLTKKVGEAIEHAEPLFKDLSFVARYMWGFRNLGIGSFILILITSAFLITRNLGILFISLSVLAYLYSFFETWWRDKKIKHIPFYQALERRIFRIPRAVKRG